MSEDDDLAFKLAHRETALDRNREDEDASNSGACPRYIIRPIPRDSHLPTVRLDSIGALVSHALAGQQLLIRADGMVTKSLPAVRQPDPHAHFTRN